MLLTRFSLIGFIILIVLSWKNLFEVYKTNYVWDKPTQMCRKIRYIFTAPVSNMTINFCLSKCIYLLVKKDNTSIVYNELYFNLNTMFVDDLFLVITFNFEVSGSSKLVVNLCTCFVFLVFFVVHIYHNAIKVKLFYQNDSWYRAMWYIGQNNFGNRIVCILKQCAQGQYSTIKFDSAKDEHN